MLSTATSPSSLVYSLWNPTAETWSAPAALATGLVGISGHAAAFKGTAGVVLVSRDPDPSTTGDAVLERYDFDGATWSGPTTFASAGGTDNLLSMVVYDASGEGHVIWRRGENLVQATLSDPTPSTVRSGSASMAFYSARLHSNADGNLTLAWQEAPDSGVANLFAAIYDTDWEVWSADRRLSAEDEVKHHAFDGYYGSDGALYGAYLATEIERYSKEVELDGKVFTLGNLPEDGATDLRVLEHSLIVDLAVEDADLRVTPFWPEEGDEVTAALVVHNAGDFATGTFDVDIEVGGAPVTTVAVPEPFLAGDVAELQLVFTYPSGGGNIAAVVDSTGAVVEHSEENNVATHYLDNEAPLAWIFADVTRGVAPLTVELDASSSFDPDGDPISYGWAFGDGGSSQMGKVVSHTFAQPGDYLVLLAVSDDRGGVGTAAVTITALDPHIFSDGFESGDTSRWSTAQAAASEQAGAAHSGARYSAG
jgi:hypothetical protein